MKTQLTSAVLAVLIATSATSVQAQANGAIPCKWVTATRTIKAPYTAPSGIKVPTGTTGCVVWLGRHASAGHIIDGFKVDFFNRSKHVGALQVTLERDSDGTVSEYYKQ